MEFRDINYPVYKIVADEVITEDGILWADGKVVDDLNVSRPSLGLRRRKSPLKDRLFKLRKAAPDFRALVRMGGGFYIDKTGNTFNYTKRKFRKIKYLKILSSKIINRKSVLRLEGVHQPFTSPMQPPYGYEYIGVVFRGDFPWLLWEFSVEKLEDRRIKM